MRSVNKVILVGNLTRDPEVRQTPNGQSVTTFGLATNREWVTRDGQRHSSSEYHEIVAWSRLAEICGQYLKKGKLVYIEGYLKTRSWDTPEGTKKFKTEIVIQDMIMLEKRQNAAGGEDFIPDEGGQDMSPDMNGMVEESSMPEPTMNHQPRKAMAPKAPAPAPVAVAAPAVSSPAPEAMDIDKDLGL